MRQCASGNNGCGTTRTGRPDELESVHRMTSGEPRKLAVLGSPIAHSKSPALHRAAYSVLDLDWSYAAIEVTEEELRGFVESRDERWLGLSLTMPLKRAAIPLLDRSEALVTATGSVNTLCLSTVAGKRVVSGYNTDIH
eukprot:gene18884-23129_t